MEKSIEELMPRYNLLRKIEKAISYGFVLGYESTSGNVHDSMAFDTVYEKVTKQFPEIQTVAMDSAYRTPWICKRVFGNGRFALLPYDSTTNSNAPALLEPKGTQYASIIRFVPANVKILEGEVQLNISTNVKSYANVAMSTAFSKTVAILPEPKEIIAEDLSIEYSKTGLLNISIVPAEAAVGKKVTAVSSSPFIVSASDATVGTDGKAAVSVTGNLPGTSVITLTLQDTLLQ